jgi:predicted LPLAT superfamily acyltransferase
VLSRERPDLVVRVVMDRGQNAAVTQLLEALCPEIAATVIDAGQDGTAIALAINEAAQAGEVIGLLVDRARPGEGQQPIPFLGQPASFPNAPWLIAAALKVPVALCFGLYRGGRRYDLHFELFEERLEIPRGQRHETLAALQARYVARLEHYVRLAPYNWFNFYDFWQLDATTEATVDSAGPGPAVRQRAAGRRDNGQSTIRVEPNGRDSTR